MELLQRVVFQISELHILGLLALLGRELQVCRVCSSGAKDYKRFDLCCEECSLCYWSWCNVLVGKPRECKTPALLKKALGCVRSAWDHWMVIHNQLSCKPLVAEYRHWLATAKLVNHRWVRIWASELPEDTDVPIYTPVDFSWCWRRSKTPFRAAEKSAALSVNSRTSPIQALSVPHHSTLIFSVSHLPGQPLHCAVSCLHPAVHHCQPSPQT